MENKRRWLNYDTLKLIVAIILVLLLLIIPRGGSPAGMTAADGVRATADILVQPEIPQELSASLPAGYQLLHTAAGEWQIISSNGSPLYLWDASLKQWTSIQAGAAQPAATAASAVEPATAPTAPPTQVPPTAAATAPTATLPAPTVAAALPTPTGTPETAAAQAPAPTEAAAAAPTSQPAVASGECSAAAPARVEVGKSARVTSNLNLRKTPAIENNLIRVSLVGTTLKIIGGPQCVPYAGGAYRWWQVEAPDGTQGWSAEATLDGGLYFLAPVP